MLMYVGVHVHNRLLVSGDRKPASYIAPAKRLLGQYGRLELTGLGIALAALVTLSGGQPCRYPTA